jgi:hypothetical protein
MSVPTRAARLAHAAKHCPLWNQGEREAWVASWRTIARGALYMHDPVGTELKSGPDAAEYMGHTFDLFQPHLKMKMLTVKANGDEMAWVNECRFGAADMMYSIETFRWEKDGTLHVKTYYDMPSSVGEEDDPYAYLLADTDQD